MATLATVRSRIADSINRSDLSSQIDQAINDAIEYYYQKENFWFEETSDTFNTVIGQESYGTAHGVPDDIGEIDLSTITISATNIPTLNKRTFEWIKNYNMGASTGQPTDYAWYQNKIYIYPIPNEVKTITLYYTKTYSALASDSDTNDYTTYATKLIVQRAMWDVYDNILKDVASADRAKVHEIDSLNALRESSGHYTMMAGIIQHTQF